MKVLIVEDNTEMRRLIKQIIQKRCDEIYECADGSQAIKAFQAHRPDWVLMDLEMPETDGISATRQIISLYPEAKIAIVTDFNSESLREAAREAGAREYIVKENLVELRRLLAA